MLGRDKKIDKKLFPGVRWKNGAYRYRVPRWVTDDLRLALFDGKTEVTLAKDAYEAQIKYVAICHQLNGNDNVRTMGELFDRYVADVVNVSRSRNTREIKVRSIKLLRPIFSGYLIDRVPTRDIMRYRHERGHVPSQCNQELETLSHIFTSAIMWGYLDNSAHPMRGLPWKWPKKAKDRIMEDNAFDILKQYASPLIMAVTCLGLATGMRKQDILNLRLSSATEEGILVVMEKTKNTAANVRPVLYKWNDERRDAWKLALDCRPVTELDYLFVTSKNTPYYKNNKTEAYDTVYGKLVRKIEKEHPKFKRFSAHDVRRRVGSDADTDELAAAALGHTSTQITTRHYRVKPIVVD